MGADNLFQSSKEEKKSASQVGGTVATGKIIGIIFVIVLIVIIGQNFFKRAPKEPVEKKEVIQTADMSNVQLNLGGNETAEKILPLPPPKIHVPPVLPPPDFARNAADIQAEMTRLKSPSLVFSATNETESPRCDDGGANSNNALFANQVASDKVQTVKAKFQGNTSYKIFQGKVIPAILETAINSDLPGMVRAIVQEDVYSETGEVVLLPKGTRLVGQYNSKVAVGQTRIYIIWSRALTPNNVDISLGSPNTNALGEAGMEGAVDTHFWKIFGNSILLSIIGAAASEVGAQNSNSAVGVYGNPYQTAVTQGILNSSNVVLQNNMNIQPTIHVNQGSIIKVFVARDLDFSGIRNQS